MFSKCSGAFKQTRTAKRARILALGLLNCFGRHTVSGMLTACGEQFKDWSAAYRLFDGERMNTDHLFSVIRKTLVSDYLQADCPIYAHMDDTNTRKRGRKIAGTSWMRDPLGPPFHTNFIWAQRYIQLSLSLPDSSGASQSRAIPVDFYQCPTVKKPKATDEPQLWDEYKEKKKKLKLSQAGVDRVINLRNSLNQEGAQNRQILLSVDGSYTNETVIKNLPEKVTLIGRIRKDCCLYSLPDKSKKGAGRKLVYGDQIPTPEDIRKSSDYPWQQVEAWAAGKIHNFDIKVVKNVRWRKAGEQNLQLVIIRPLSYRLTKKSKLLYRNPAYLISTDTELEIKQLLQAYLWRWEIEVNFHEEKSVLGCGQAQVRKINSVKKVPAFIVSVYAFLLMAAHKVKVNQKNKNLPRAKWYTAKPYQRQTTGDILNTFRAQIWAENSNINFSHFVNLHNLSQNRKYSVNPTLSAAFYMRN